MGARSAEHAAYWGGAQRGRPRSETARGHCGHPIALDPDGSPVFLYCQADKGHTSGAKPTHHTAVIEAWNDDLGPIKATITWLYP